MSKKGPTFEREMAVRFSLWWSAGQHDDLFWRTAGSGGRATARGQKRTKGHCGDLGPTCAEAEPFFKVFSVELKRGYKAMSPFDAVDRTKGLSEFERWWAKAVKVRDKAGAKYPMVVYRRNQKRAMVALPKSAFSDLPNLGPIQIASVKLPKGDRVYFVSLDDFFNSIRPLQVRQVPGA